MSDDSRFKKENRVEKGLVTLKGAAVTTDGQLTRSNYFNFIRHDLDDYSDISMTPKQARKISQHLQKLSTGATAMVPMYCGGASLCPFADRCPYVAENIAPVGKQCALEVQLVKEYIMRIMEEYDVDPTNFTEIGFINELAEIEILLMRLNMSLSRPENAELIIDQTTGIGPDGTPVIQKQVSPFMDQKEKLYNRRARIIKLMVGDRQEKYKKQAALKTSDNEDPSSKMSQMRSRLDSLSRALDEASKGIPTEGHDTDNNDAYLSPEDIIDANFEEDEE